MASEINPTRINQPKVDLGQEISPDGGVVTQMAAPTSRHVQPQQQRQEQQESTTSLAEQPNVDESGNEVTTETSQEASTSQTAEGQQGNQETQGDEGKVTDFTQFLQAKETGELTDEIHKKKVEETEVQVQPKGDGQQQQQVQQKPTIAERKAADLSTRDLTGLDADLQPHFQKDMSRAAFDKIKPIILEHKTLKEAAAQKDAELERLRKGAIPDSYYENPNGYVLDPSYQQAEMNAAQAHAVLQHWQKQYKAVQDGATEYQLANFDANGNLIPTQKVVAGANSMQEVLGIVNGAQQQLFKMAGKAEAVRETFKQRHTSALSWLDSYDGRAFPIFRTEAGKQFEPQVKTILGEFPPEFRNHPLAATLARSLATNVHLATLLVQNNKGQGRGQQQVQGQQTQTRTNPQPGKVQQQRRAGPTVADTGAATPNGAGNGKGEVSIDDFNKAKEEQF